MILASSRAAFWADVIVAVHLAFVVFVIAVLVLTWVGAPLGWRWVRNKKLRIVHLVCVVIVPIEAVAGVLCPLTTWENELRYAAGETPESISFVGRLMRDILFYDVPQSTLTVCYVVFGLTVLATYWLVPPRRSGNPASHLGS